ncbi:MAG: ornithine carbamoyltransferase [Dehalococcoidia bacterium]|nr:ornithine carbamoyltransferase [Dehalococcoidia bacterium]|tara:strand:- start:581 stop:1507 length:927 start_codon:yes stop_codon:yes gene_type:complete
MTRHLLDSSDLTPAEIGFLLDTGLEFKSRPQKLLEGRHLALLFEKPSLRTRVSFQVGMHHLGGETLYLAPEEVGLGDREAIKDVARVLARYVDVVAVRTFGQSIIEEYARFSDAPVVNALTDDQHPCQALADLLTLKERFGELSGRSLAFIGDGNNVCSSLIVTAASLGMHVRLASPDRYRPAEAVLEETEARADEQGGSFLLTADPEEAAAGADALYTDTWVSMGQEREAEQRRIDFVGYRLDQELVDRTAPDALIMHDLPAHRGEEITDAAMESPNSIIFDQAANRVWAQVAVVAFLLELVEVPSS